MKYKGMYTDCKQVAWACDGRGGEWVTKRHEETLGVIGVLVAMIACHTYYMYPLNTG